jgi:hypothetical protein
MPSAGIVALACFSTVADDEDPLETSTSDRGRESRCTPSSTFRHYLHHRLFTVNFGAEAFPSDWWFKTQHDGSPESLARIRGRTTA